MKPNSYSPIIIIGMHRSGTGMIVHLLEQLGLFIGKQKQGDYEALFFFKLNDWLLRQSGGAWDQPEPIQYLLTNTEVRSLVLDYMRHLLKTPRVISYLGWANYLRYGSLNRLNMPWGWKDPRNTYTLPLWLDIFPSARVVHVYRHGVDVANSSKMRAHQSIKEFVSFHQWGKRLSIYWFYLKKAGFTDSVRCAASLENSFSLWEAYLRKARNHVYHLADRALEIKYEDFLEEPQAGLIRLAQFCGLDTTETAISQVANQVKQDRAYAYRTDPELQTFAYEVRSRLAEWGY